MTVEYVIGDKVRIKSDAEIVSTLDKYDECDGIYYDASMCEKTGKEVTIAKVKTFDDGNVGYQVKENSFIWSSKWLSPITAENEYLNDGSIEQISLCLALIRQTLVGNPPDLSLLITSKDGVFPITADGGFDYVDFKNDIWSYSKKIAGNIPDWPCLKLKPEILEKKIKDYISKYGLKCFEEAVAKNIISDHLLNNPDNKESWIDLWDNQSISWRQENEYMNSPFKTYDNEIKFQRKKGSIFRGTVPEGNQQSSGKCKTATCSGYICYQVCTGR